MKSTSLSAAAIVFLVPVMAFAAQKNSATVQFDQAVMVADTQIAAGQYKVSWEGSGPDVTVSFADGNNKTVLTALAKFQSNTNTEQAVETDTAAGGTPELNAIDLRHVTLQFENAIPSEGN